MTKVDIYKWPKLFFTLFHYIDYDLINCNGMWPSFFLQNSEKRWQEPESMDFNAQLHLKWPYQAQDFFQTAIFCHVWSLLFKVPLGNLFLIFNRPFSILEKQGFPKKIGRRKKKSRKLNILCNFFNLWNEFKP